MHLDHTGFDGNFSLFVHCKRDLGLQFCLYLVPFSVGQVNQALQLTPDDFREKYGSDMPCPNDQVVFSCLAGIRSKKALDTAVSLGYSK